MPKQKNSLELTDEKNKLSARALEIAGTLRKESRMANAEENKELVEINARSIEIATELSELDAMKRSTPTNKELGGNKFSLRKAISAQMNRTAQRDIESAVIAEAAEMHRGLGGADGLLIPLQSRAALVSTTTPTDVIIDTNKAAMILDFQNTLLFGALGVTQATGLNGNLDIPRYRGSNVAWAAENASAADGAGTFSKSSFSPKRLTAYVDISKQLLVQESFDVEGLIRQTLVTAISQKLEATAFGKDAHATTKPDGFFVTTPTTKGAISWASIVGMETSADLANAVAANCAYVMHPSLFGKLKTAVKDASGAGGFLLGSDGTGMVNGYRALRSNNVASGMQTASDEAGIIFGNFADYFVGQWGALDITVDPYSKSTEAMVRLVINSYWDMGAIRPESFIVATGK